jgi:crotonobetainyl-CoA:carnitine CoA-transferase CaiB-like acyl-CoA transferase
MLTEVPHETLRNTQTIGAPVKFSRTPAEVRRGAPLLGQHTREILTEIGFSLDEIERMEKEGTVSSKQ